MGSPNREGTEGGLEILLIFMKGNPTLLTAQGILLIGKYCITQSMIVLL